jgi:O2-independent ubiquinone biosynthesis protein UbiV
MAMNTGRSRLAVTLGPVLFNWPAEIWRDFYFRIADEAPVSTVYVGEVICSKRAPLFAPHLDNVVERLEAGGKTVVLSSLSQVASDKDRQLIASACATGDHLIEANDTSALHALKDRPHHVGPFINVYNERAAAFLVRAGARNFCLPPEMSGTSIRSFASHLNNGATVEVLVFGRVPLALSARCYHARAHGRTKDSCQFVCEDDPNGLALHTLEGQPFLTVNGIQTLSYEYLSLADEVAELRTMGVTRFRLSPHTCDMVTVATVFNRLVGGEIDDAEATAQLQAAMPAAPFCNGFYHSKPGYALVHSTTLQMP